MPQAKDNNRPEATGNNTTPQVDAGLDAAEAGAGNAIGRQRRRLVGRGRLSLSRLLDPGWIRRRNRRRVSDGERAAGGGHADEEESKGSVRDTGKGSTKEGVSISGTCEVVAEEWVAIALNETTGDDRGPTSDEDRGNATPDIVAQSPTTIQVL